MASVITNKYRTGVAQLFMDDFDVNSYYIFASTTDRETVFNTADSRKVFLEKTIFGKQVDKENVFFAIQNRIWQPNTIYDQYSTDIDLNTKNFYVIVYPENNDTGNYLVFKCLSNNYGALSTASPTFIAENTSQIYRTADGYIWKFMYSLSTINFNKYITLGYIPILESAANTVSVSDSSIDIILVDNINENNGYESAVGIIDRIENGDELVVVDDTLNPIPNIYSGMTFYAINSNNVGEIYEIDTYTYNTGSLEGRVTLRNYVPDSIIQPGTTFSILPRVEINGDGSGCKAISILDEDRIIDVLVLDSGEGYTSATARIVDPAGFNPDLAGSLETRATITPILSPSGGHGSNLKDELYSRNLIIYNELTPQDNITIPTTNQYAAIGLVKNPDFYDANTAAIFDNRLSLELDNVNGLFIGESVSQTIGNEITFSANVHEIDANTNTVFLTNYHGPYQNYVDANTSIESDISLNPDFNLLSSQSSAFSINSFTKSNYVQKTGDVLYLIDFEPNIRTIDSNEEFKILLEF